MGTDELWRCLKIGFLKKRTTSIKFSTVKTSDTIV